MVLANRQPVPIYEWRCWRQFHRAPRQLRQAIDDFVAAYNATAAPFEWKKAVVFPSKLKSKYSDLCK